MEKGQCGEEVEFEKCKIYETKLITDYILEDLDGADTLDGFAVKTQLALDLALTLVGETGIGLGKIKLWGGDLMGHRGK
jgi:hypothetical protein